jgi:hypothetical protein
MLAAGPSCPVLRTTANYLGQTGQIAFAESFYRYFVFHNPSWSYATMNLERDVAYADQHVGKLMNSIDPDLRPFRDRGGKLESTNSRLGARCQHSDTRMRASSSRSYCSSDMVRA